MATHGMAGKLVIGTAATLQTTCEDGTMDLVREVAESRPWDAAAVTRVLGKRSLSLTASGENAVATDLALWTAYNGDVAVALEFYPLGGSFPKYSCNVVVTSYQLRNPSNDKATYSITVQSTGTLARAAS